MAGVLFKNNSRETDSQPHYKGSAQINGCEMWLSAWINTSKDGKQYLSIRFKPKQERPIQQTNSSAVVAEPFTGTQTSAFTENDLPF